MQSWIITGGVGCGKSTVVRGLVEALGPRVRHFSSDAAVQELLDDPEVMTALREAFGEAAVRRDEGAGVEKADRAWLRQRVFGDAGARERLEGILHPAVLVALEKARAEAKAEVAIGTDDGVDCLGEARKGGRTEGANRASGKGSNLFLAEVPLHYEIGGTVSADLVIVVAASQTVQVRRLMERRGLDQSIIQQMLRAQWPIEAKVERADVVIWNDGDTAALQLQVLTLARQHWSE